MKTTGKNRVITDKFYTNDNVVEICFNILNKYQTQLNQCKLIEPSAGSGSFLDKLSNYDFEAFDIEPAESKYKIVKQDFLQLDLNNYNKPLCFIGNPPFGRQSSIAKKFIKKISNLIPLGRMAKVGEYKSSILYMISEGSSYMNGSVVIIDGGRTVL